MLLQPRQKAPQHTMSHMPQLPVAGPDMTPMSFSPIENGILWEQLQNLDSLPVLTAADGEFSMAPNQMLPDFMLSKPTISIEKSNSIKNMG